MRDRHTVDAALLGVGGLFGPDRKIEVELIEGRGAGLAAAGAGQHAKADDPGSTSPTRFARTGVGLKVFGGGFGLDGFDLKARGTLIGLTGFFQTRDRPAATLVSSLSTSVGVMSVTLRDRHSGKTNVLSMLA